MTIDELYQKGWTVRAAARAIGVSANHLSLFLRGKRHSQKVEVQLQALPVHPPLPLKRRTADGATNTENATTKPPLTMLALRRKGWTSREAARALGLSESHLCLILQGKRRSQKLEEQLQALPPKFWGDPPAPL